MAKIFTFSLIIAFLTLTKTSVSDFQLSQSHLDSAIRALRAHGYHIFANAIEVSDVAFDIVSYSFNSSVDGGSFGSPGFTFLVPPNSAIINLDMQTNAFTYENSIRLHVIPRRFSYWELRKLSLSLDPYLETLVPHHHLSVELLGRGCVAIEGLRIARPDLYLRHDIAVHGLSGIFQVSNEEYSHRFENVDVPPEILPPPTLSTGGADLVDGSSSEFGGVPAFEGENDLTPAPSPQDEFLSPNEYTYDAVLSPNENSTTELSPSHLDSAIRALRAHGYHLFANAIEVSDVAFDILSHSFNSSVDGGSFGSPGFTFLAPPSSAIFNLDMQTNAFTYENSIRLHVIPRRFSYLELLKLSFSLDPYLETLVPHHHLSVESLGRGCVAIEGLRIARPDLYLRHDIAVHGLRGIFQVSNEEYSHRFENVDVPPAILPPPTLSTGGADSVDGPSSEFGGVPAFSPEVEKQKAHSPYIGGIQPFPSEFDETPAPVDGFSPEMSPIGALLPEYDIVPASNDVAFTGGTSSIITNPPIEGENDLLPAPSPQDELLSPNEYTYDAVLSPNENSTTPVVNDEEEVVSVVTVQWVESRRNVNKERKEEHKESENSEF